MNDNEITNYFDTHLDNIASAFKFSKVRDVKSPSRGTLLSAGLDFFVPEFSYEFMSAVIAKNANNSMVLSENRITINPHGSVLIPSGIKTCFPENYALIAFNKSGVCTSKQLLAGGCVVDADYEGELHIHLINTSAQDQYILYGQKIIQFILIPVSYINPIEVSINELFHRKSNRGEGGFGSTGSV